MNKCDKRQFIREILSVRELVGERFAVGLFDELTLLVKKHHTQCEAYCNKPDFDPQRIDATEWRIRKAFDSLNHSCRGGLTLEFQRDPRGPTVKIQISKWNFPETLYQVFE